MYGDIIGCNESFDGGIFAWDWLLVRVVFGELNYNGNWNSLKSSGKGQIFTGKYDKR